jgi:hypothetical protein
MSSVLIVTLLFAAAYLGFLYWYGGRGKSLTEAEVTRYVAELIKSDPGEYNTAVIDQIKCLVANDDGNEFVMQNLVRYRTKALYPNGNGVYGDDPRVADQRPFSLLSAQDISSHLKVLVLGTTLPWFATVVGATSCALPSCLVDAMVLFISGQPLMRHMCFQLSRFSVWFWSVPLCVG